jgi:ubiquinone biosynthesis protein
MNKIDFIKLMWMLQGNKKVDIKKIQDMGLLAVKIGQVYALRLDFLPPEKCKELSKLYRSNIQIPSEELLKQVDKSKFKYIDEKPIATASVGQVYKAKLKNGDNVVIKIVKKDFKEKFEKEVRSIRSFINFATFFYPKLKRVFDPNGVLDHIEDYTLKEMNLLNEIKGQEKLKEIYEKYKNKYDFSILKFPKIYKNISNENVMVSEYIEAKTFDELLDDKNFDYRFLLKFFEVHGTYLFLIGLFHGDVHPGNIMLKGDKIYYIDTGAISTVEKQFRKNLLLFFKELTRYNYEGCCKYMQEMSEIKLSKYKYDIFVKDFKELYKDFKGKTVSEVSLTKKMMDSIKLAVNSGMKFNKGMFTIIKSLMYLDGMVLRNNPSADLIKDMKPAIDKFTK